MWQMKRGKPTEKKLEENRTETKWKRNGNGMTTEQERNSNWTETEQERNNSWTVVEQKQNGKLFEENSDSLLSLQAESVYLQKN